MMKGFAKKGKYLAMMLLAFSLIFAGCATGGSSEEDSAGINDQGGIAAVPMKMDMDSGKLTVGDGTGPVVANINGHTVEVVNGNSTLAQCIGTGPYECWLRIWNRDSDEYMANVFITLSRCPDCDAYPWQLDNADAFNCSDPTFPTLSDAFTVHTNRTPGNLLIQGETGAASPINTVGIAYASDSYYPEVPLDPNNPYGAPLRLMPSSVYKADWMIMPQCGMQSQPWIFSGSFPDPQFEFWGTVIADYFPLTPVGDPRYNTSTKSTLYIIISDVINKTGVSAYEARFRNGTPQRSNVLAGFGAPGNTSLVSRSLVGLQYYFGVTLGMEASDWMENQVIGDYRSPNYYYYGVIATLISWDSNVATGISVSGNTKKTGGTYLTASFQWLALSTPTNYNQDKYSTYASLKFTTWAEQPHFASVACRLNDPALGTQNKFRFFPKSGYMIDDSDRQVWLMSSYIPNVMGQRGFADVAWAGAMSGTFYVINSIDTGLIQQGIDADVDIWAYTRIFKLNKAASAVGTGTVFRAETFSGFFDFRYYNTSGTMEGGPFAPGTDDDMAPTVPTGCSEEFCIVLGGLEVSNWQIRHRGPPIEGTYQAWNTGICIAP